jgi:hypothetical protein
MKSIMALSMHKAGSSIADRIIEDFCVLKGYEIDRIASRVPGSPLSEIEVYKSYQSQMKLENVYYGIARQPGVAEMQILPKLRIIAQVRDPRDCITSAFFSFRDSHVPPDDPDKLKAFLERREQLKLISIDDFALKEAPKYARRLEVLSDVITKHTDLLLLHYEEMVLDTANWMRKLSHFIEQPITPALLNRLGHKINFKVLGEDSKRHKRQVTPGDHKRKLQPVTIGLMNKILCNGLGLFGYAI